jgi:hypothetical protein
VNTQGGEGGDEPLIENPQNKYEYIEFRPEALHFYCQSPPGPAHIN